MRNPRIVYQSGNTLRLLCSFYDWSDRLIDPPFVIVRFYDNKQQPTRQVTLGNNNKSGVGKYFYDYASPMEDQTIWYEFYCEIDGLPNLQRDMLVTAFVGAS